MGCKLPITSRFRLLSAALFSFYIEREWHGYAEEIDGRQRLFFTS